ncbi:MAG: hypothetical protein AAF565_01650 [Pseudomonadota bacterium]
MAVILSELFGEAKHSLEQGLSLFRPDCSQRAVEEGPMEGPMEEPAGRGADPRMWPLWPCRPGRWWLGLRFRARRSRARALFVAAPQDLGLDLALDLAHQADV